MSWKGAESGREEFFAVAALLAVVFSRLFCSRQSCGFAGIRSAETRHGSSGCRCVDLPRRAFQQIHLTSLDASHNFAARDAREECDATHENRIPVV
jgi:hypothetical protein